MNFDDTQATYRILDASSNRALEGLRTLEEYARFVLNDASLAEPMKFLRHDLAAALSMLPREKLLRSRDTAGDIGTQIKTDSEYQRGDSSAVVAAASARVQQSLRCLEEYGKVVSVEMAVRIESIRYRCYDVCAKLELRGTTTDRRRMRIRQSTLYVLSDAAASKATFVARLNQCIAGGVDVVQLRDRRCSDRELFSRARIAANLLRESDVLFIVNDRADIAAASGADGVHVGQDELLVDAVRLIVGDAMLIGVSTHSIDQAREAIKDGADYIGIGPCFPSQTKSFAAFVDSTLLREVAREITVPAFAIGGITTQNVDRIIATGIERVAVSASVCAAANVEAAARELKDILPCRDDDASET